MSRFVSGQAGAGLGRLYRLRQSEEFSTVLACRQVVRSGQVVMYYAPNGLTVARLGLIVSRKVDRRAVVRNLVKRIVREAFRTVRMELPPLDIVVRALAHLRNIERSELRSEVDGLFSKLAQ